VTALSLLGEAVGIAIAFHVSPLVVLETVFDFDVGIRPGWEVLAAGLCVVVVDLIRSRAGKGRAQAVAAE
jgi:sulfoxide reductase heme-binding subunit YedZ